MANCKREVQRRRRDYERAILMAYCFSIGEEEQEGRPALQNSYEHLVPKSELLSACTTAVIPDCRKQGEITRVMETVAAQQLTAAAAAAAAVGEAAKKKRKAGSVSDQENEPPKKKLICTWDERLQALVAYKAKHGNCNVPFRCEEGQNLGRWVSKVRGSRIKISTERRGGLDKLGFNWETKEREQLHWNKFFSKLKACSVSILKENSQLSAWVDRQRQSYLNETIRADRIQKLESIGFVW
jgi:hypothetical protein